MRAIMDGVQILVDCVESKLVESVSAVNFAFVKVASAVARLDTMSSRIQSMNLSMNDNMLAIAKILNYLHDNIAPFLVDSRPCCMMLLKAGWD